LLLQGFPGGPYSYTDSLDLPRIADSLISSFAVPPFIAVIPPAGVTGWYDGEWAGPWESFVVRDVLPWTTASLPVARDRERWAIAGLSAGGYGAVDMALRHPFLFGTIESWSGYFGAPRDGPLRGASRAQLLAHDPYVLTTREAPLLRRLGTRFFVVSATTHDRSSARAARRFAYELRRLHLPFRVVLAPGGHDGAFWRAHLAAALRYALAPYAAERTPASSS
jgi:enterochelin esterase-like enzyme